MFFQYLEESSFELFVDDQGIFIQVDTFERVCERFLRLISRVLDV